MTQTIEVKVVKTRIHFDHMSEQRRLENKELNAAIKIKVRRFYINFRSKGVSFRPGSRK